MTAEEATDEQCQLKLEDFSGELCGDVPCIVEMENGQVVRIVLPEDGKHELASFLHIDDWSNGVRVVPEGLDKEERRELEARIRMGKADEAGGSDAQRALYEALGGRINELGWLDTDCLALSQDPYRPGTSRTPVTGPIDVTTFTGQILAGVMVRSSWYVGEMLTDLCIDTSEEPCCPSKMRRTEAEEWEDIPAGSINDFYSQISGQPLRTWVHMGETIVIEVDDR
jgi:hypothetical protein